MKYIVCKQPGEFAIDDKAAPSLLPDHALIRIRRIGICGTDLHAFAGNQAFFTYPRILGHELAGEILEIGENSQGFQSGDQVAIMPYISCGTCIACRNGKPNCCTNIEVLGVHTDGGMQEIISVPTNILMPAGNLSLEEIAIIEPLAIGAHAIRRAQLQAGEYVLVMGCGPIGIGIMKLAQSDGAKVIALDINAERLAFVQEKIGVTHTVDVTDNPLEAVKHITNGDMATAVFDATGNAHALMAGPDYMSHGGRYILVGLSKGELTYSHPAIHAKETTLMCSRNATKEDFQRVMDTLEADQFPTDAFVTHQVGFEDMIGEFEQWLDPKNGVIKAMIHID